MGYQAVDLRTQWSRWVKSEAVDAERRRSQLLGQRFGSDRTQWSRWQMDSE